MAKAISALVVDLHAETASFSRDMKKATGSVRSFGTRSNKALGGFDRAFGKVRKSLKSFGSSILPIRGMLAGLAAGGLLISTKKALDFADAIGKAADAIGISTATLQEFRYAADLSGVATEALDKGFKKFSRNMGELGRTSSETQTSLKDLDAGLLAQLRSTKGVEAQLNLAFKALAGYADQTKRAAVAAALFGRAGIDMTNIVRDGIDALAQMRAEAKSLGLVISDEMIRGAEKANDQLSRMEKIIGIKLTEALLLAAPEISSLAQRFIDALPGLISFTDQMSRFFGLIEKSPAEKMARLKRQIDALNNVIKTTPDANPVAMQVYIDKLKELRVEYKKLQAAAIPDKQLVVAAPARKKSSSNTASKIKKLPGGNFDAMLKSHQTWLDQLRREGAALSATVTPLARYNTQIKRYRQILAAGGMTQRVFNQEVAQANETLKNQGTAAAAAGDKVGQAMEDGFKRAGDAVIEFAQRGEFSLRSFGQVALSILGDVLNQQLQVGGGGGGFGGVIKYFVGNLFSGSGSPDLGAIPGFGKGLGLPGFANGGGFTVGGSGGTDSRMVAFRATPGERVSIATPSQQRGGGGGGGTYIIDARGADKSGLARLESLIHRLDGSIENRAMSAVQDARFRDPAFFGG